MKLQHTSTLVSDLNGKYLLLDTTVLINASKSDEFLGLLSESSCSLITIPSVTYEFSRNANTIEGHNERQEFIKALNITVLKRMEDNFEQDRVFKIAYAKAFNNKSDKGPSYTDALLCSVAYKFRGHGMLIMTANHRDMPSSMFDRIELITIDIGGELRNEAIYSLSPTKLNKLLDKLA